MQYTFPIDYRLANTQDNKMGIRFANFATTDEEDITESFSGYYRSHDYDCKIKGFDMFQDNKGVEAKWISVTDDGLLNVMEYNSPYVISNIDIQDNAKNGVYNDAITAEAS